MKQFNLEEYLKNPSRKVVTRDGRNVTIHCTNYYLEDRCIIAEIEGDNHSQPFNRNGKVQGHEITPLDLFFAPEKHEGWVNVFEDAVGRPFVPYYDIFTSKESAEESGKNKECYIATAKIEWEE